jgi:hypothetical protein
VKKAEHSEDSTVWCVFCDGDHTIQVIFSNPPLFSLVVFARKKIMTSTLTISEIKAQITELLSFENTPSAQDIRDLAESFPTLAQIIESQNFSKKDTWVAILSWAQDCTDWEENEEKILDEKIEGILSLFEPIEDVAECSNLVLAERSEEKTAIYYAVCCLAVFCILTIQLSIDIAVWIFTWLVPALAKLVNSTVEKIQDVYRLYKQVSSVNYLFIQ